MILTTLTLGALLSAPPTAPEPVSDLLALRVGRAETIANGTIENAVILIEGGEIVIVGEDLPIERGIPTIDLPDAVVMPGMINCRSRLGLDSRAGTVTAPQIIAGQELVPGDTSYQALAEYGITTVGLYPPGRGVMGQATAVQTGPGELVLDDSAYLAMTMAADRNSKNTIRKALDQVADYLEDVEKDRKKWKEKREKSKKKDDDEVFEPEVPDEDVLPLLRFVTGELRGQFSINKSADLLHLWDVLADQETVRYDIHIQLRDDLDLFYIKEQIGERELRVICDPEITAHPGTRRERNLPAELAEAGAHLAFVPRSASSLTSHRDWRMHVGELVAYGLDRQVALRALTLEPAHALDMGDHLGSLEAGKRADLLIFDGDPFETTTKLQAVLVAGDLVHGELYQ
ncbi:MAG: amidohydrolase family protein [Planctomycetota bacterium]|jgi:hypothetical protein